MTDEQRIEIIEAVDRLLWRLRDQDEIARVALASGMSVDELRELGGI